jgi:anti-anti-sigma factor
VSANGSSPFTPFGVSVSRVADEAFVLPRGELDLASADTLTKTVTDLWSAGAGQILIDLEPLDFIDSCGLRALLDLREEASRGSGGLALCPGTPAVQRIFDLTGTRELFRWTPD